MKKFALTAIIALATAAPAVAQTQLERSVGAAPGEYTLSQLIRLKQAQTVSASEARTFFQADPVDVSSNRHSPTALRAFEQLANEQQGDRN